MSGPLDSRHWYRVRTLAPRLRAHVHVSRHVYRGRRWYVLEDRAAGRSHRLDANAWQIVGAMNGTTPVDALWHDAVERLGDDAPSQDQAIQLLGTLHAADLIQCDLSPDARELFARRAEKVRQRFLGKLRSPFFLRLPLLDPTPWLEGLDGYARGLFSRTSLVLWLLLVGVASVLAGLHWPELYADAGARLAQPKNYLALALVYPLVKGLHELGHALAIRAWRGEVHDTGLMLLVFMPVPYVDATAANAFESKWARACVAGAGIAVELALAAGGLLAWLLLEPGLLRTVAFDVMLIGGVSTLLFNGNPLLKFDGYYVLADLIEIPNLASRSNAYYGYLLRRYVLGIERARSSVHAAGERRWFLCYGLAAFAYRTVILCAIVLFVLNLSWTLGVLLGSWAVFGQVLVPTGKRLRALYRESTDNQRGRRALAALSACSLALCLLVFVPVPQRSMAQGVVWLPEDGLARAATDCFVERVLATPGTRVTAGTPLIACTDPLLDASLRLAEATVAELKIKYQRARRGDRNRVQVIEDELRVAQEQVDAAHAQLERLTVRSPTDGRFVLPTPGDWPGRFVPQGKTIGYVLPERATDVRVAIEQGDIGLVRQHIERATVRFADYPERDFDATVLRTVPSASRTLPSAALGTAGGGVLAVDPANADGRTAVEPVFQLELRLTDLTGATHTGGRAYVRLEHGHAPLARQAYQRLRQLFLKRLAV